jgi:ABC-2 type transport system permease protein
MASRSATRVAFAAALPDLFVLMRFRAVQTRNLLDQQLKDAPVRTFVVLALLALIWSGLYFLLNMVFWQINRWEMIAVVANKPIFVNFFLVLAVMLAFSNAILGFGSLFGRGEPAHLLSMPIHPRQVLAFKWVEGMLLSGWSFLLLGVPLMLAVASNTTVPWYYYPLFVGHFLGFMLVPATFGLIVAWAVAMWVPRQPLVLLTWVLVVAGVVGGLYLWNLSQRALASEQWLKYLFAELSIAKTKLLPSTWTAEGIVAAIEKRPAASLHYLCVVLGNAAFLCWLTINLIGHTWAEAYSRARRGFRAGSVRRGWATAALCRVLFFYLPRQLRMLMLKEVRGLVRDATQWTQMAIMLGLLVIYALNLKRLPLDLQEPLAKAVMTYLNLTIICLIMATFTSRFVYPLLSLETQQMWLLGMLPAGRSAALLVKFIFALTATGISSLAAMSLAVHMLGLPEDWASFNLFMCFVICFGLSGLSVGLGARFPVLGQRNPARIASGFGGTVNLVASMLFVAIQMLAVAALGSREIRAADVTASLLPPLTQQTWQGAGLLLLFSTVVATAALWSGSRHFDRLEC